MIKLSDYLYIPGMGRVLEEAERSKAAPVRSHRREYAAAKMNRLNSGWSVTPLGANWVLTMDLRTLRARARQMSRDASHFKRFLKLCVTNVIGPKGMRLQCRAYNTDGKTLNVDLNKRVEDAFWSWGHAESCTVTGKMNWKQAQRLFVRTLARDGEVLVQKVQANNAYGFSLKFIDVSYLDELLTTTLPNGNRIIMSVEIDASDRPVAYWLTTPATESIFQRNTGPHRVRVPADEIIHAFLVLDDESQVRGVTWFHAAMTDAKNLHGYKEGVITSARAAAMSMGFLVPTIDDEKPFEGDDDPDGNEKPIELNQGPAAFTELPTGYDVKQFDPKQPTQNHEAFYKSIVRDIAAGLDVNYFSLQGDMAEVNFSSGRLGYDAERDVWREIQDFVADNFCRPVFQAWAKEAVMSGGLRVSMKEFVQIQDPVFRGRGWSYIEPLKDITASSLALENKLTTYTDELAERGIDLVDHLETLKAEKELAAKYGIDLSPVSKITATESNPDEPNAKTSGDQQPPAKRELTNGHGLQHIDEDIA